MTKLTEKQKATYINSCGTECPFCYSENIVGNEINIDSNFATQEVSCNDCDEEWKDIYTLQDVDTIEDYESEEE